MKSDCIHDEKSNWPTPSPLDVIYEIWGAMQQFFRRIVEEFSQEDIPDSPH